MKINNMIKIHKNIKKNAKKMINFDFLIWNNKKEEIKIFVLKLNFFNANLSDKKCVKIKIIISK